MFDKEFKIALQNLPESEKDKLIFRLLKRDIDLANRLYFELVDIETVDQKREKMTVLISKKTAFFNNRFYNLSYLLLDTKSISGDITEHVKITKDKFGDASLNLQLVIETLERNKAAIVNAKLENSYKIIIYLIAKTFKILIQIKALDEDFLIEFRDDLHRLGKIFSESEILMKLCINNGLDINWLSDAEIPDNIVAIHKQIRAAGFLK